MTVTVVAVVAVFAHQCFLACLKYASGFMGRNSACHDDSTPARQNVVCLTGRRSNGQYSVREENQSKVWFQMWNPCVKIQYRRIATGIAPEWLGKDPCSIQGWERNRPLFALFHIEYASGIPPHTDLPPRKPGCAP